VVKRGPSRLLTNQHEYSDLHKRRSGGAAHCLPKPWKFLIRASVGGPFTSVGCRVFLVQMPRPNPRWIDEGHPWSGIEHDWLGVDVQGHVAVFTTAGWGAVPMELDQHLDDVDAALDRVRKLPEIGSAYIGPRRADVSYSDWDAYSAKGFYAYDWQDPGGQETGGPYLRLSSPTVPISVSQLPADIQALAHLAWFPLKFADEPKIIMGHWVPAS